MKTELICGIRDNKLGFVHIYKMPNKAIAIRDFAETASNEKTIVNKYPEDHELVVIGELNMITGEVKNEVEVLAKATDFITKENANVQ